MEQRRNFDEVTMARLNRKERSQSAPVTVTRRRKSITNATIYRLLWANVLLTVGLNYDKIVEFYSKILTILGY